ncbi:hypothetical protein [Photobacterium damselae]|uniref:hypothetical protein n=1 Tax=Photobacterium damselae TaxID=38293 RepID=UPI001EFE113D|nr:hypothetical protein [Photobacterium damselae]MCG9778070.1 hypothetical protein [Photobacterium damselae]
MKRTSIQQLKKDFTVFPFPGLGKNSLVDFEFEIYDTKLKKAKATLAQLPDLIRNLKNIVSTGKKYNKQIIKFEENLSSVKRSMNEIKLTVTNQYDQNKFLGIIMGLIVLMIFLFLCPFMTIFILALFSYISALTLTTSIKKVISQKNTLGHVSAVSGNRIFIHNKDTDREERTISHEHCHLMQFNNSKLVNVIYDTSLNLDKLLLNHSSTAHERYLFSKIELEVRVHEFIRVVYYKNGRIPMSLDEFYYEANTFINKRLQSDILGSDLISCYNSIQLSAIDFFFKNQNEPSEIEFLDKWTNNEKQLKYIFIREILFPCYINLVRYYGYIDLSNKLGSEIMGPNLYNYTYQSNL